MIPIFLNSRSLWRDSRAFASGVFFSSLFLIGLFGCIQDSAKPAASKWSRVANNLSLASGPVFLFARGDSLLALSGAKRGQAAGLAVSVSGDGKAWVFHPQAASGPVFVTNAVAFRDTLWAIGPDSQAAANKSDTGSRSSLWKSRDGAHWAEVLHHAPFGDRDDVGFLATENGLWVVSGKSQNAAPFVFPGTWHSEDGNAWSDVGLEENPFATASSVIGLRNRIFVIGGGNQTDSSANLNIRSSADGIVWNANAPAVGLLPRWNPCLAEHAGRLWVIGGDSSLSPSPGKGLSDVWSSVNGWQWILEDVNAPFATDTDRSAVSWRGGLWVVTAPNASGAEAGIWLLSPELISP